MIIETKHDPWKHWIIDDFLPEEDYKVLYDLIIKLPKARKNYRYAGFLRDEKFDHIKQMYENRFKIIIPNVFGLENLDNYKMLLEYNCAGKGLVYPIHEDAPEKIFSIVHYITPELGTGTLLHTESEEFHSEVKWKPNRALMFRRRNRTFHSYRNELYTQRRTINCIFVKKDHQDEEKNLKRIGYYDDQRQIDFPE